MRQGDNRVNEIHDLNSDPPSQIGFRGQVWNNETKHAEMEEAITAAGADFPFPAAQSVADQVLRADVHPAARAANTRDAERFGPER